MMDEAVQEAVNAQLGKELSAAYSYLAMSAQFHDWSLLGFSKWMRMQAQEELGHAMKLFDFLNHRDAVVKLGAVPAPSTDFKSALSIFDAALAQEREVSGLIHRLYDLAVAKHDHATQLELQWFITEQVEEEDVIGTIVDQLRMAGENEAAILMLDRELGGRATAK